MQSCARRENPARSVQLAGPTALPSAHHARSPSAQPAALMRPGPLDVARAVMTGKSKFELLLVLLLLLAVGTRFMVVNYISNDKILYVLDK